MIFTRPDNRSVWIVRFLLLETSKHPSSFNYLVWKNYFGHFCDPKPICLRRIQICFNAMRLALFLFSDFGLFVFCFWKLANTPHQSITVVKGWEMNDWIFAWTCHIFSETRLSSARADTTPEILIINREFKSWLKS